jgi:hypothetical protein
MGDITRPALARRPRQRIQAQQYAARQGDIDPLREVSPKCAATSRDFLKREESSIAVMKLNAAIGPTPGICMKRRHNSFFATSLTTRSCNRQYPFHSAARIQHGVDQLADKPCNEL